MKGDEFQFEILDTETTHEFSSYPFLTEQEINDNPLYKGKPTLSFKEWLKP